MKYRSIAVPVIATQLDEHTIFGYDNENDYKPFLIDSDGNKVYTDRLICFDYGEWFVEFPNKEFHIISDKNFKLRFEATEKFTKKELDYADRLAQIGDCD